MIRTLSQRPTRRATYVALVMFGLAYLGIMGIIFAPQGSFSSRGALIATEQVEKAVN